MAKRDYPNPLTFKLVQDALKSDQPGRREEGVELREELDRRSSRYMDLISMAQQIISQEPKSWGARKLGIMLEDFEDDDE